LGKRVFNNHLKSLKKEKKFFKLKRVTKKRNPWGQVAP
jgi:hypothetical protein